MNCEQCGKPLAWKGEAFQHADGTKCLAEVIGQYFADRWENGVQFDLCDGHRVAQMLAIYIEQNYDTRGGLAFWKEMDTDPPPPSHLCEYETDGGGCKTCGKTVTENLLSNDKLTDCPPNT